MKIRPSYTFNDLLLVPKYSNIHPQNVDLTTHITPKITLKIPFVSAAMDTVTEHEMAIALALNGGIGVIHKNLTITEQIQEILLVKQHEFDLNIYPLATVDNNKKLRVLAAIAANENTLVDLKALIDTNVDAIVLDSAHGHSENIIKTLKLIKKKYPKLEVVVGNIATQKAAIDLINAGADALKVGMGPGSICITRIIAGIGVPQMTAISDVFSITKIKKIPIIADGGIKFSGDIVKALAAGANCVMMGKIFAATNQAPGEIIEVNHQKYKSYVGMGSLKAMQRGSADRYFQTHQKKKVAEGIEGCLLCKGDVQEIIFQYLGGVKSGLGYCGASNITKLQQTAEFVSITNNGLEESHAENMLEINKMPNYK